MHIGFLTSEYPGFGSTGGIGTSIQALAHGLAQLEQKVTILVYNQKANEHFVEDGITIRTMETNHGFMTGWLTVRRSLQRTIHELVIQESLDIIEVPDWSGIGAFMQTRCPMIIRIHGSDAYFCRLEQRRQKIRNYIQEYAAIHNATGVVSVSRYAADLSEEVFFADGRIQTVVPNACPEISAEHMRSTQANPVILYFGTLNRKKGVFEIPHIFNEVARHHGQVRLRIIGRDSRDPITGAVSTWKLMMQHFTPEAFDRVQYHGVRPHSEIIDHLHEATACLFPSFAEAFPVSWLEAMAAGCPIVTSDTPWAREMFTHGREGFMEEPARHKKYASYLLTLLTDTDLRDTMGRNAVLHMANNYNSLAIAQRTLEYYVSVLQHARQ